MCFFHDLRIKRYTNSRQILNMVSIKTHSYKRSNTYFIQRATICKMLQLSVLSRDSSVPTESYPLCHPLSLRLPAVMNVAVDHMITANESLVGGCLNGELANGYPNSEVVGRTGFVNSFFSFGKLNGASCNLTNLRCCHRTQTDIVAEYKWRHIRWRHLKT